MVIMKFLGLLLLIINLSTSAWAQLVNPPVVISANFKVLGDGDAVDLNPKALAELYHQATIANFGVKLAKSKGRTVLLTQNYIVFHDESNVPTQVKREVILNASVNYGKEGDHDCAVKIIQEGSFTTNGNLLSSLTHHIEIPHCEDNPPRINYILKPEAVLVNKPINGRPLLATIIPLGAEPMVPYIIPEITVQTPTPTPTLITTPTPSSTPPLINKPCAEMRAENIAKQLSEDSVLKELEAKLAQLKNNNKNANGDLRDEQVKAAALALSRYPQLSKSLNELIAEVYKTHRCPTKKAKRWVDFKNVAEELFDRNEHLSIKMDEVYQAQGKPTFFCGYNESQEIWYIGASESSQKGKISEKWLKPLDLEYVESEPGIWNNISSSEGEKSYRDSLNKINKPEFREGDDVYFKIADGVYLDSTAFTLERVEFLTDGFFANSILFTDEAFKAKVPPVISVTQSDLDESNVLDQIKARKNTIISSILPCEEEQKSNSSKNNLQTTESIPSTGMPYISSKKDENDYSQEHVNLSKYMFGHIAEKKIAFLISASKDYENHQGIINGNLIRTIADLKEDQYFTITFVSNDIWDFKSGELIPATRENKRKAIEFIRSYPLHYPYNREKFDDAYKKVNKKNGNVDRVYLYTDGNFNFSNDSDDDSLAESLFNEVKKNTIPFTIRTGSGDSVTSKAKARLEELTRITNGTYIHSPVGH